MKSPLINKIFRITLVLPWLPIAFATFESHAGTIVALQNQEVTVPINSTLGSIIQLPAVVNTVTPSKYYSISDVGAAVEPNSGVKSDVRTFQIKPIPHAKSESVTFILAGGKNLSFRFTPAMAGDKFYDIHFERPKKLTKSFMNQELSMMRSMILDENGGFPRRVIKDGSIQKLDKFSFTLKEIYQSSEFTGFVFDLKNRTREAQTLNLSQFSFGAPNKAIMAHANNLNLDKCPFFGSNSSCTTRFQVIVKGNANPHLSTLSHTFTPPFEHKKEERTK